MDKPNSAETPGGALFEEGRGSSELTAIDLPTEINRLREKLLDLSLRNPLLNYRKSKRRTVQIVDELPNVIYDRLVNQGKKFSFESVPDQATGSSDDPTREKSNAGRLDREKETLLNALKRSESSSGTNSSTQSTSSRHTPELPFKPPKSQNGKGHLFDDKLRTNLTERKLYSLLHYVQREAKTAVQETGINYLHIAIGFLAWREAESSDSQRFAPLVLIPVQIENVNDGRRGQSRYMVSWTEDEVTENLCLIKKLERDFGIELPPFDPDSDLESYFADVLDRTRHLPQWSVQREAVVGFFSFHKLSMYADIDPERWDLSGEGAASNMVERVICGTNAVAADASMYAKDYDIDHLPSAEQIMLPMDADSSQHSALCDIRSGKNLVIEGPPGTGKSQTIANAIADAMASGKTVLFVAEKLTALQVVHHRLETLGLGEFCLELHSDAASPRHVFESLRQRLSASYVSPDGLSFSQQTLADLKAKLNGYVKEMAQLVGPRSEPLYDVMWEVVELRNRGAIVSAACSCDPEMDRASFQDASHLLKVFGERLQHFSSPRQSPWWGYFPDTLSARNFSEIEAALRQLRGQIADLRGGLDELAETTELPPYDGLLVASALPSSSLTELADAAPSFDTQLFPPLIDPQNRAGVQSLVNAMRQHRDWSEGFGEEFGIPLESLRAQRERLDVSVQVVGACQGRVRDLGASRSWVEQFHQSVRRMGQIVTELATSGFPRVDSLEDFEHAIRTVQLTKHSAVRHADELTEAIFDGAAKQSLEAAKRRAEEIWSERKRRSDEAQAIQERFDIDWTKVVQRASDLEQCVEFLTRWNNPSINVAGLSGQSLWSRELLQVLRSIADLAQHIDLPGIGRPQTFADYEQSVYLLQLLHHPVLGDLSDLSAGHFSGEGKQAYRRAKKVADVLAEKTTELEEAFHLPSVPDADELNGLIRTLRRYRRSWFPSARSDYRAARQRLDEFIQVDQKRSLTEWIRALETLQAVEAERREFRDDGMFRELLGPAFQGVDTDWDELRKLFDWANTAKQRSLDYPQCAELLQNRDQLVTAAPLADLVGMMRRLVRLIDEDSRKPEGLEASHLRFSEFTPLGTTVQNLDLALNQLKTAVAEGKIGNDITLAELREIHFLSRDYIRTQDTTSLDRRTEELKTNAVYREHLGPLYAGADTDWTRLGTLIDWAGAMCRQGIDFALSVELIANRERYRSSVAAREMQSVVEQCRQFAKSQPNELSAAIPPGLTDVRDVEEAEVQLATLVQAITQLESVAEELGIADRPVGEIRNAVRRLLEMEALAERIAEPSNWQGLEKLGLYRATLDQPDEMMSASDWVSDVASACQVLSNRRLEALLGEGPAESVYLLARKSGTVARGEAELREALRSLESYAQCDESWLVLDNRSICDGSLEVRLDSMLESIDELSTWAAFGQSLLDCRSRQLHDFCDAATDGEIQGDAIADSFRLTVLEQCVENAFRNSPTLQRSTGADLQSLRREFQEYDRGLRELHQQEIAFKASQRTPPVGNSVGRVGGYTELGLIRHETQKQMRHCRIRDLMLRAGTATQTLKPCFMMSPLSVSRFIPQSTVEFDMVIMDEASQIKPEDALGTLLRAKQLVVVGDPKQLPPTSFFDRLSDEVDEEESTQMDNTESILEASMKVFQPFRRLRWHYRSQHESLIRFSNHRFYDNDLVVFPSKSDEHGRLGVSHVFVDNAFCTSGLNTKEAEAVVAAIVDHAIKRPEDSLGVGAFNKKQAELIDELLQKRCDEDAAARMAVARLREQEDELFIKNLENVQGDERDVIFVCYTYGKDPQSRRLFQRFGPINGEKGWRRLNVLITRSRKQMVVFSSIRPSDIQGGPDKRLGVNAYKDFLTYAMTGDLTDQGVATDREPDSPFELAVARCVASMGLEAVPQVGVAGFFVDIGVRRREGDRSFVLGIECDGATYHSARSARDRDRLREEVIRSRGWNIHRIWSTDWFLNQSREEEKLRQAVLASLELD